MKLIDAHIHLDQYLQEKIPDLIHGWQDSGIDGVIAVSTDLKSCYDTLEWRERFPHFVHPCLGWHPEQRLPRDNERAELLQLIHQEKQRIVGVGEVGLPHYSLPELGSPSLEPYIEWLTALIRTARAVRLPVALHAVHDKAAIVLNILQRESIASAHFHWLKADASTLTSIIESGYVVSVTPEVCYRERDQVLVRRVPLHQLMLETDGPWPFAGPFQGKETTPLLLKDSVKKIAKLKDISGQRAKRQVTANVKTFYRLKV